MFGAIASIGSLLVGVQNGPMRSVMALKNTLTLDSAAFAEVREKPSTTAYVVGTVAIGLLQLATRSRDSISATEMEAVADPSRYREVVSQGLGSVGRMVVQRLREAR